LHPIPQELVTGYARFKGSKEWEGRSRMIRWKGLSESFFNSSFTHLTRMHEKVDHPQRDESLGRGRAHYADVSHRE
ncbi:hypothetical protein BKA82DRAFT_4048646, partial [Pisolithus tinctorius]